MSLRWRIVQIISTVAVTRCLYCAFLGSADAAKEGELRLSIGTRITTHEGQGHVEVYHKNQWGSICDDEWDEAEGRVVCRKLGFKGIDVVTYDGEFGAGRQIFMDDLYCSGSEETLTECHFPGWQVHDCEPTELAGVRCIREEETTPRPFVEVGKNDVGISIVDLPPDKPQDFFEPLRLKETYRSNGGLVGLFKRLFPTDLRIRLRNGRTLMEGRVEVYDERQKLWGLICADGFGMLETMSVCRQAGFAYGQQSVRGSAFATVNISSVPILIVGLKCNGDEQNLADCRYTPVIDTCPDNSFVGVVCAEELPDLVIDKDELERSTYLEDRQLTFLTCAMEENCLSSSAYEIADHDRFYFSRRLLRFTTRVANTGSISFRPFLPKDQWIWHACHQHYHSMEVFAHYDVVNATGQKVAEGHKASFCLEDNFCDQTTTQVYACANYGDQGISVGCVDTYLHNIDCQWVDVTDIPVGNYTFKVKINPDYKLAEATFDNNAASCELIYTEQYAAVRNCLYERP
ncbi:lysyl oxidase homolog 2-like isoform X2 [Varroa destructor]|uniref:protein-lysine 6-oxidase n=1 Tax=Varroa destructor TaxID=109461 RepID=A0A7M7KV30_VARDE|nr:lysyl oxidase homolog 2-like isoform X2 [Varroa destructor]